MCNLWPFRLIPTPGICIRDAHSGVSHLLPADQLAEEKDKYKDKHKGKYKDKHKGKYKHKH